MKDLKKCSDAVTFVILAGLAVGGLAVIVHTAVVLILDIGFPGQFIRFLIGAGIIGIAWFFAISYAILDCVPPWKWGQRICERIRRRHADHQKDMRDASRRHLDGLSPEERVRAMKEITEDSFLHPENLPYDRCEPGRFD